MALPEALRSLPEEFVPQGLAGAHRTPRDVAEVLFEQQRSESLAFCRTVSTLYALHRVMYADDEAAYLAAPGDYREAVEARRRLTSAGEALDAQVSTLLRVGPSAARHRIELAIGFVERLPRVFALIGENVISPKAAEVALHRSRVLTDTQAHELDGLLADRLSADYAVLSIPALRDEVDLLVSRIDPEAAERRRRAAESDRRITFRPEEDGMAAAFALLPAQDIQEFSARVDYIAGTVCDDDPRTTAQRRADGAMQLIRGFSTLGCDCDMGGCRYQQARYAGEPDADGVITRFITMINVVINEKDLAAPATASPSSEGPADADSSTSSGLGYLVGHGPISGQQANELAARPDAKIRPFGQPIAPEQVAADSQSDDDGPEPGPTGSGRRADPGTAVPSAAVTASSALVRARGSSGYRPSTDLRRYLRLVFPRCVFPHCNRPAARAQIDHRREYDHHDPELGGKTTADEIQPLCLPHHQLKTAGDWIDARLPDGRILWSSPEGRRYIIDPHGIVLRLFPDLERVEWINPEPPPSAPATTSPTTAGRTRLQQEHARREQRRQRNVEAMQAELTRDDQPASEVEELISRALKAPPRPWRAPSFDGPPPF